MMDMPSQADVDNAKAQIKKDVESIPVVLYMKGNPAMPQCGFSGQSVAILESLGVPFESRNVLEDPALRQGIKEFSDWPTIPQLYVNGTFVGGCDIMVEMYQSGDLANLVKEGVA